MSPPQIRNVAVPLCLGLAVLTGCSHSSDPLPGARASRTAGTPFGTAETKWSVVTFTTASPASAGALRQSADRLRERAEALGITGVRVEVKGGSVEVMGPASAEERLKELAEPGRLRFRPVLQTEYGSGESTPQPSASTPQGRAVTEALADGASGSPSASAVSGTDAIDAALQAKYQALDCSDHHSAAEAQQGAGPEDPIVACGSGPGAGGSPVKYLLGPAILDGTEVSSAKAAVDTTRGMGWFVKLGFNSVGSRKFAVATGELSRNASPQNQFAIVVDDGVVSAPSVSTAITGGNAEISGGFTEKEAQDLAAKLNSGALPTLLKFSSSTTITKP